eukprot:TRINITY_DN10617_c0_g1_i1.p2 TRINITY_DN10617_c0_g1~~TRINITY_DN10617_c0_g1_i1.p2  ORF type:complete len:125 (+),score=24.64 TRINITY_DN10617_c0_g1_i1:63-437(+)
MSVSLPLSSFSLYRKCIKSLPDIKRSYRLPYEVSAMETVVRQKFRLNAKLRDPSIIRPLIDAASKDLEECLIVWKQKQEVLRFFQPKQNSILTPNPNENEEERELMEKLFNPGNLDDFERHLPQ